MPTFNELQEHLAQARFRKAILLNLIEYIDENFCPSGGQQPQKTLLTDERLPVPVEIFEAIAADTLTAEVEQLDHAITQILNSQIGAVPPPAAPKAKKSKKAKAAKTVEDTKEPA